MEDFYTGVLKEIGEALKAEDQNLWFWQQYYKKIRREYQKLLSVQHKEAPGKAQNLAQTSGGTSAAASCDAGDGLCG